MCFPALPTSDKVKTTLRTAARLSVLVSPPLDLGEDTAAVTFYVNPAKGDQEIHVYFPEWFEGRSRGVFYP